MCFSLQDVLGPWNVASASGDCTNDQKRFFPTCNFLRQRTIWGFMYFICVSVSESNGRSANRHPTPENLKSGMPVDAVEAVEDVYRSDWGRIVAALIGLVGDFDLAEESAQEAFTAAVDQWRESGVPEFPRA